MASIICDIGSTSTLKSNHARIVNRNIHIKGLTFFDLHLTSYSLTHRLNLLGTPINIQTDLFEAKMSQGSIMQNIGYEGLITEFSQGTNPINQQSLIAKDSKRTWRSLDKMTDVKKKRKSRIKNNSIQKELLYQNIEVKQMKMMKINPPLLISCARRP